MVRGGGDQLTGTWVREQGLGVGSGDGGERGVGGVTPSRRGKVAHRILDEDRFGEVVV